MSRDNSLWGTERIRGELLKLGIVVSKRSIRSYRWRKPVPPGSKRWRSFLANEIMGIWAADLLVVQTVTYRTLYVFFFITHDRREIVHFIVTGSPTAAWIWRQLIEATPWGRRPQHLIHGFKRWPPLSCLMFRHDLDAPVCIELAQNLGHQTKAVDLHF
jgi:hypothetical protein